MKKMLITAFCLCTLGTIARCQYVADSTLLLPTDDMQWWRDAKFGLFIHYGLYSIPGRGEWVMWEEQMDTANYSKLRDRFACEKFNAARWVEIAREGGCRYMVVTARHHDGFCLFDTHYGTYDTRHSAAKRDLIAEYVQAAHAAGMRTGIYYSPLDWRFPGFFLPDFYRTSAEEMKKQTYGQVRELLTQYGKVDILWYDGGEDNWLGFGGLVWNGGWQTRGFEKPYTGKFSWEPIRLNRMVRRLQPKIVISQRSGWMGDFETQEVHLKGKPPGNRPWELCTLLGDTAWGWTPYAASHVMSLDSCVRLLVTVVSQDGNLILNVGPRADGSIEPAEIQRLREIGVFLSKYGESIYATRGGIFDERWGGTTVTDKAIYVHILTVPLTREVHLPPVAGKIASATYMRDMKRAIFVQSDTGIQIANIQEARGEPDIIVRLLLDRGNHNGK